MNAIERYEPELCPNRNHHPVERGREYPCLLCCECPECEHERSDDGLASDVRHAQARRGGEV